MKKVIEKPDKLFMKDQNICAYLAFKEFITIADLLVFSIMYMSQSIPTGYISLLGNPGENFFEQANPGHPGTFFLIPLPGGKMMVKFPGVGQNFPKLEETAP